MIIIQRKLRIFRTNSLTNHVILCQSPRFIRNKELNPAQIFRNVTISSDCSLNLHVSVDAVAIPKLSQVQINPQRDRDDGRKKQNNAEKEKHPVPMKPIKHHYREGDHHEHGKKHFGQKVDFGVEQACLGRRPSRVHLRSCLPSRIHDHSQHVTL